MVPQDAATPSQDRIADAIERLAAAMESGGLPAGGGDAPAEEEALVDAEALEGLTDVPTDFEGLQVWLTTLKDRAIEFLPLLAGALAILIIGWLLSKLVTGLLRRALNRSKVDQTLVKFLCSCVYMVLMAFVIISAITKLGVNTASFVAVLGAAGFAIGFAMQGSLSNFAAGVMLMLFRPLRTGDLVEAGGILGTVEEVGVFATVINTLENKRAIIANSEVTGGNIINYSANGALRVDMQFGIGYGDDMDKAVSIMMSVLQADERVLKDPAPTVACVGHGASSVDFVCRPYVHPDHYWDVWFDTHKKVKEAFDAQGVSIPFPQRDVHMHQVAG